MRRSPRRRLVDLLVIPVCAGLVLTLAVLHEVHVRWGER